jgi:hypothetical protein
MDEKISAADWMNTEDPTELLHTPMSKQAFSQYNDLLGLIDSHKNLDMNDKWIGTGQGERYSSIKMYRQICGGTEEHVLLKWLWKTANRLRHKIFFW